MNISDETHSPGLMYMTGISCWIHDSSGEKEMQYVWNRLVTKRIFWHLVQKLWIVTSGSGGPEYPGYGQRLQKALVARWLYYDSFILLVEEPTKGIDAGTKAEIYKILNELCRQGKAVVVMSSESPELMAIMSVTRGMMEAKWMDAARLRNGQFCSRGRQVKAAGRKWVCRRLLFDNL